MKRRIASAALFLIVVLGLAIRAQPVLTISPSSLPIGGGQFTVGQQIPTQQLTETPVGPATWSIYAGNFPPGLNLDSVTGAITGTPTQAGSFTFTVLASEESFSANGFQTYTVIVTNLGLTVVTPPPPGGAVGSSYASFPFQLTGGVSPYTWAFQSGANVDGLTLDSGSGLLSGIPIAGGQFPVAVSVIDSQGSRASASFTLNVLGITTSSLATGALGVPYTQTLAATGATGPLTWSLAGSGTLPPGLSLNSTTGAISGTSTAYGTFPIQIHATDTATKLTATRSFNLTINSVLTVLTTSPLPNGAIGTPYSQTLLATGGTSPYTWSATGLPAGLTLDPATGILSGTPTAGGTSTISVTVTDAAKGTAAASLSLTVGALTITPATLPNGFVGISYTTTTLTVPAAGALVSNWAVTAGTLPAGLTLNASTGAISGTPTTAGTSTFTITASFASATSVVPPVVQAFTLVINAAPTVTISGLSPTGVAATQPPASVTLSGKSPVTTTGTLTLAFKPLSGAAQPYDAKFASGQPYVAPFTIATGDSQGLFAGASSVPVMIGTVAGTITITTSIQDPTLTPPAPVVITVNPTVPVITKVTFGAVTNGTFTITVTGRSTTRDMTSALFHFALPTTTQPSTLDVTVPLTTAFTTWYASSASVPLGSTFAATVQFSFTGPIGSTVPFTAVTVTMTNSVGASNAFGPTNP